MTFLEELEDYVSDLMMEYGPDGHADGCDIIAKSIYDKYIAPLLEKLTIVNYKLGVEEEANGTP